MLELPSIGADRLSCDAPLDADPARRSACAGVLTAGISMHPSFITSETITPIPIWFVSADNWQQVRDSLPASARRYADAAGFEPKPGQLLLLPGEGEKLSGVLLGLSEGPDQAGDRFLPGRLPSLLPGGAYEFANSPPDRRLGALAFGFGAYRFTRYRQGDGKVVRLKLPDDLDGDELSRVIDGVTLARDLINTPANDLGPEELDRAVRALASRYGANVQTIIGDDLLADNFPLIHAVGRASTRVPRLIDLRWGDPTRPKVTLVGKGVCFDTGGLDLKTSSGMLTMKKDMGGAANVLALAHMVMDAGLQVRLRVIIPAVENAVSGSAFRPLDIYRSRKGLTVEIGNTDAEGRLILADALALADEETPDLLADMATLTGAARVALGPDLPPFYTDDELLAADLSRHGEQQNDPLWRMPLWRGYESLLDSKVADINNVSSGSFAGSITAALFLLRFVTRARSFVHFDIFAWTPTSKPGRPEGGECQAARALYSLLRERYGA